MIVNALHASPHLAPTLEAFLHKSTTNNIIASSNNTAFLASFHGRKHKALSSRFIIIILLHKKVQQLDSRINFRVLVTQTQPPHPFALTDRFEVYTRSFESWKEIFRPVEQVRVLNVIDNVFVCWLFNGLLRIVYAREV